MVDNETIAKEYIKCNLDKTRIYLTEHYYTTNNAGKIVPFTLFPRQKEFMKSLAENKNSIAIKHRQAGITTVSAAWIAGQIVMATPESPETVLCIANQISMASDMLGKIKNFIDQTPRWMWCSDEYYSPDPNSEKNYKSLYVICNSKELRLFNGCRVVAKSSGENASRGVSAVSILVFDEAAFIENGPAVYSSAVSATSSVPHARTIMVSTPNGKDELYYHTYQLALDGKNGYNAVEFKWFQDLRYNKFLVWKKMNVKTGEMEIIREEVLDKSGTIPYDEERWRKFEQEGWKPESPWYLQMCEKFNYNEVMIAQELDVSFVGSANNVVSTETIDMHRNVNVKDPVPELADPLVKDMWVWKPPMEGHRYICSCDNGTGDGTDSTVIEIIDMDGIGDSGQPIIEQVAEYQGKMRGDDAAELIYKYATLYNTAYVVIEDIGGYGSATILTLIRMGYKNMYYDDENLKTFTKAESNTNRYKIGKSLDDRLPGFHSSSVRLQMLSLFAMKLKNNAYKVRSIRLINELETWIYKNGRPDHMHGCHDDTITCTAMGLFVLEFSFNKMQSVKAKDAAILRSYMTTTSLMSRNPQRSSYRNDEVSVRPSPAMQIYSGRSMDRKRELRRAGMIFM